MDKERIKAIAMQYQDYILHPFGEMMDMSGFDAITAFAQTFGGSSVYVPSVRTIFKQCIEQDIFHCHVNNKNINIHAMSKTYGFSERHIRNLLRSSR
jgi:Mor family transcriptional regulator